jgi:DNA repair photolyase
MKCLSDAGIPVRVMASSMTPELSDHELEAILQVGRDHGATSAFWIMLRLPHDTGALFEDWLTRHYPNRRDRVMGLMRAMYDGKLYDASFETRMRGRGVYAEMIQIRFQVVMKRLGFAKRVAKLRSDLFLPHADRRRRGICLIRRQCVGVSGACAVAMRPGLLCHHCPN